jgi:nitroreductase
MLQTLMLSAHVRGLGTCAQGALALWSAPVRDAFVVPEPYRLLCGVSIGFPSVAAVNAYSPERLGVEAMLLPGRP